MPTKPVALTLATSDSGGGAGIQADIKAMEAQGVFATSVLAAITAQNTRAVTAVHELPPDVVAAQIDAVAEDFPIEAAKTGMLFSSPLIETVVAGIEKHGLFPLVVDPVMVSKSGHKLLQDRAVDTVRRVLIPLATVVTPNAHEASVLADLPLRTRDDAREAARRIYALGPQAVLVKGGHIEVEDEAVDLLFDGDRFQTFSAPRIDTANTHGTGCTYASAIAANLAKGIPLAAAIGRAKQYVTEAIRHALSLGHGHGPTNHFYHLDPDRVIPAVEGEAGSAGG